ncbi:MAG: exodeoxyribonuclease VII large subunit, partial [Rhodocyclaceae bacterium]|nr:exodeoxyribonuclease VII large subunit [Rhodocyclaceae bacterium]
EAQAELSRLAEALGRQARRRLQEYMQRIDLLARRLVHPGERLGRLRAETAHLATRLAAGLRRRLGAASADLQRLESRLARCRPEVRHARRDVSDLAARLGASIEGSLAQRQTLLSSLAASLEHLSPLAVLGRGYSLVRKADGSIVRDARQLSVAEAVQLTFGSGAAEAQVTRLNDSST